MCGLCGVLSPELTANQQAIFQELMVLSTLRGPWGAGAVIVPKNSTKQIEILRNPDITAAELAYSADFYRVTSGKGKDFVCMMGHARMPTTGGTEIDDCHPHVYGNIVGMHNGTMDFVAGNKVGKKDSDSKMLFEAIAEKGIKKTLETSRGAYALTIANKSAGTLSFIRNDDRPLYFAKAPDVDNGLYWASEAEMLHMVLLRRERFRKATKLKFLSAAPFMLLHFRLHNLDVPEFFETTDILAPTVSKEKSNPEDGVRYITKKPYSMTRGELDFTLASGCAYCGEAFTHHDYAKNLTHFYEPKTFICHGCLTHDPTAQEIFTSSGLQLPPTVDPIQVSKH